MHILFRFKNIPCSSTFIVFDDQHRGNANVIYVASGDSEISIHIPGAWQSPFRDIRGSSKYYIPNARVPIDLSTTEQEITGDIYYLDAVRPPENEELNQSSIENIITTVFNNQALNNRQKFYISLLALQSYFEQLTYGMLVLSGYISSNKFEKLNSNNSITKAFDENNPFCHAGEIHICPGKAVAQNEIPKEIRENFEAMFQSIRRLRNRVTHRWGYQDIGCEAISDIFRSIGENVDYYRDEDDFYGKATLIFLRLYAKGHTLGNRVSILIEKEAVRLERESRGYI